MLSKDEAYTLDLCRKIKKLEDNDFEKLKIDKSIDLNHYAEKTGGWLPLHFAAKLGKEKMLKLLIDNGANPWLSLKCLDKKTGFELTWKNSFTLIGDEKLRESIKAYYINSIRDYNLTTLVNLPSPALFRIALNLLPNLNLFSNLVFSTQYFSLLFSPYIKLRNEIAVKNRHIKFNLRKLGFFENFCETEAREMGDYAYSPKEREEQIEKLKINNISLANEVENLSVDLGKKMNI